MTTADASEAEYFIEQVLESTTARADIQVTNDPITHTVQRSTKALRSQ